MGDVLPHRPTPRMAGKAYVASKWAEGVHRSSGHTHVVEPGRVTCIGGACEDAEPYAPPAAPTTAEGMLEVTKLRIGRAFNLPMSIIDGRPWVPTAAEACPCAPGAPEHDHCRGGYAAT